jgi:hypothetical protein
MNQKNKERFEKDNIRQIIIGELNKKQTELF